MKKHLLAVAVTALAVGSAFAQANDTLAKIKAAGFTDAYPLKRS